MASAAFRSSSRRSSIGSGGDPGEGGSSSRLRRSRSFSCCPGTFPPPSPEPVEYETPRGRFVNKVRGSGVAEISLDDLAEEFFRAIRDEECEEDTDPSVGRSDRRPIGGRLMADTESSRRRGRPVSRHGEESVAMEQKGGSGNRSNSRMRRSVSVSRSRRSESEVNKIDERRSLSKNKMTSACGSIQKPSLHKKISEGRAAGRSISEKEFFQSQDCYSSHSSSLTDDETQDARLNASVSEKTICEVYDLEKEGHYAGDVCGLRLYEDEIKEIRDLVDELTELKKCKQRKQNLLADLAVEEQRGQELCKIVRELLSSPKEAPGPVNPSQSRQRSSDKLRMSKCLNEEAERYFEDFLSNVEDTDLSSFDGERSDTGSTTKLREPMNDDEAKLLKAIPLSTETDGVNFPWLRWEATNSSSPSPCKTTTATKHESETLSQNSSSVNQSSLGSCSPEGISGKSSNIELAGVECRRNGTAAGERNSSFDMDEYLELQRSEDLLFEIWEQRHRIASGGLVLCGRSRTFL